jgi:predicted amino acid-binding ACT domain protein
MLVLDLVKRTSASSPSILVPRIHSGHLGFVPGTRVHVGIPPATSRPTDMRTEVLVTPFQTTPNNTALISIVLRDAVGVVRSLVQALSWLGVNIEVQESSSIDHLDLHRVGMIVDLGEALQKGETSERVQRMYRQYAANVPIHSRRYVELFDIIVAQCGHALWWHPYEEGRRIPALYVRPLPRRDELNTSSVTLRASADKRHTEIELPDNVTAYVRSRLDLDSSRSDKLHYVFVSDTNDRTLRAFFLPEDRTRRLVHIGLYHQDVPGTLARMLDVVASAEFNIITSLLRKYSETTSSWEAILEYRGVEFPPSAPHDLGEAAAWYREQLIPWIHERLSASPLLDELSGRAVSIGPPLYPKDYGGADLENRKELSPSGPRKEDQPRVDNTMVTSLLSQRQTDLVDAQRLVEDHQVTKGLLEIVTAHRERVRQRTLFLSYPKTAHDLVESYLRPELIPPRRPSYHLTKFQDSKPPDFQLQIIQLIARADYFLGIWHPDESPDGKGHFPARISPWMYFEYGIARSMGKPIVVACHEDLTELNPRRLVGNNGLVMYDDANFAKQKVDEIRTACNNIFRDDIEALFNTEEFEHLGSGLQAG